MVELTQPLAFSRSRWRRDSSSVTIRVVRAGKLSPQFGAQPTTATSPRPDTSRRVQPSCEERGRGVLPKHRRGPRHDLRFDALMRLVKLGLNEEAQKAPDRGEAREGPDGLEYVRTRTKRGARPLPVNLVRPLSMAVDWFGPANAALALAIAGFLKHDGFPGGPRPLRPGHDIKALLRGVEQRLRKIHRTEFRRHGTVSSRVGLRSQACAAE
jgi:hypothetical protein